MHDDTENAELGQPENAVAISIRGAVSAMIGRYLGHAISIAYKPGAPARLSLSPAKHKAMHRFEDQSFDSIVFSWGYFKFILSPT